MSRVKKDATNALTKLSHYLRRDKGANEMVQAVSRYLGELRQNQSALKNTISVLEERAATAKACVVSMSQKAESLTSQLSREAAAHRQVSGDLARARRHIAELEKQLGPEEFDVSEVPPHVLENVTKFTTLFKDLRKHLLRAPERVAIKTQHEVRMFELTDIVKNYSSEQYTILGMLVTVCCLMDHPVGFQYSECENPRRYLRHNTCKQFKLGRFDDKHLAKFVYWIRDWIHFSPLQEKIYGHADLPKTSDKSPRKLGNSQYYQ